MIKDSNNCLYFGKQENLTFNSKEHIFPSFLGGIEKFEKGVVSDQANRFFSKFEEKFANNSIITNLRAYYGPGKRGKINPKFLEEFGGTSPEVVEDNGEFSLGILANKYKPYDIPQIIIDKNDIQIHPNNNSKKFDTTKKFYNWFIKQDFDKIKFRKITSDKLNNRIIISPFKGKVYWASNHKDISIQEKLKLKKIKENLIKDNNIDFNNLISKKSQIKVHQEIQFGPFYSKFLNKIALNYLCSLTCKEFVQVHCKETISHIIEKNNNEMKFNFLNDKDNFLSGFFNNNEHCIHLSIFQNTITAYIGLYNQIYHKLKIGTCNIVQFIEFPTYVCDFMNNREYKISHLKIQNNYE